MANRALRVGTAAALKKFSPLHHPVTTHPDFSMFCLLCLLSLSAFPSAGIFLRSASRYEPLGPSRVSHSMTIRRLPDVRVALLCRRLPHDTRVLAIMDFLGTETVYLFWTHRRGKVWQWSGYRLPPGDLIRLLLGQRALTPEMAAVIAPVDHRLRAMSEGHLPKRLGPRASEHIRRALSSGADQCVLHECDGKCSLCSRRCALCTMWSMSWSGVALHILPRRGAKFPNGWPWLIGRGARHTRRHTQSRSAPAIWRGSARPRGSAPARMI